MTGVLGATLLGAGCGILLVRLVPLLASWWPLGLVLGGLLLWRRAGTLLPTLMLVSASLSAALVGGPWSGTPLRTLARFESSADERRAWQDLERVVLVNGVGDVVVEGGPALAVAVVYRSSDARAQTPEALQASYDPVSRSLGLRGVEPLGAGADPAEAAWRGLRADLELTLPPGVALELTNGVGRVRVRNVQGELRLENGVGDLELNFDAPLAAPLVAATGVGDLRLGLSAASDATVRARSGLRRFGGGLERVASGERRRVLGTGEHAVDLSSGVGRVVLRTR